MAKVKRESYRRKFKNTVDAERAMARLERTWRVISMSMSEERGGYLVVAQLERDVVDEPWNIRRQRARTDVPDTITLERNQAGVWIWTCRPCEHEGYSMKSEADAARRARQHATDECAKRDTRS